MVTAGIIGWPISHSRSPSIHGLKIPVEPQDLPGMVTRMNLNENAGVNANVPHKEAAFALVSETELMGRWRLRTVNTEVVRDGRLVPGAQALAWDAAPAALAGAALLAADIEFHP